MAQITYRVGLANKIERGRAVGNLWGVARYVDGRRNHWVLEPQASEQHARAVCAALNGKERGDMKRQARSGYQFDEDFDNEEPSDEAPDIENNIAISDARGGKYSLAIEGRHKDSYSTMEAALKAAVEFMDKGQFFYDVYYVNDHGNVELLKLKIKRRNGRVSKVDYEYVRGWV